LADGHNPCRDYSSMNEDQTGALVNFKDEVIVMCDYSFYLMALNEQEAGAKYIHQ
jgi:hypothetical protein